MDGNEALMAEAVALAAEASAAGIDLRLMGGMAVRVLCPSSRSSPFARICSDIDCFALSGAAEVEELFARRGWKAQADFNLYNGDERLRFSHPDLERSADVFLGRFRMCHEIDLSRSKAPGAPTIAPAELLLTKLQVVEANEKDLADAFCILADCGTLDAKAFAAACARDWGLQRTIELSLGKLADWAASAELDPTARAAVLDEIEALRAALAEEPKSPAWKLRSIFGTRMRWYELPEEPG